MKELLKFIMPIIIVSYQVYSYDMINLEEFQKEVNNLIVIDKKQLINDLLAQRNKDCTVDKKDDNNYLVSPSCLLQNKLPKIDPQEAIDYLRSYINGFETIYNDTEVNFSYEGTFPILKENLDLYPYSMSAKKALIEAIKENKMISIQKKHIAFYTIKDLGFYTTKKDISILKKCTKQNYSVGIDSFDGTILKPNETLNLNQHLNRLPGYCKGVGSQNLMFYGGVCGFITQLFRTSIILPEIEITKRYPHSVRLSAYYSNYIFGDDATVYEMSKQFEIKNNSEYPIYFKKLSKGNSNFLVAILLGKSTKGVNITKKQTGKYEGTINIETYDLESKGTLNTKEFYSKYDYISDARR